MQHSGHAIIRKFVRPKKVNRSVGGNAALAVFLFGLGCFILLPFVYSISNAFKPVDEIFLFPPRFFPMKPTIQNFINAFSVINSTWVPFSRYLFNTTFITVVGTLGSVIIASMAAFVLSKHTFFGSKTLFRIIVLSLMFSQSVVSVPNYLLMADLHWIDNWLSIIMPSFAASLGLYPVSYTHLTLPTKRIV